MPSLRALLPVDHPLRRGLRSARDATAYCQARLRRGVPDVVVTFGDGGIGDSLLCTAVCHELHRRGARRLWMLSPHPELFSESPDVTAVLPYNADLARFLAQRGHRVVQPHYNVNHWAERRDEPPGEHIIAALCRRAGIDTGEIALRPHLHLTTRERAAGRLAPRQIVIQASGRSARFFMPTKEWFPDRFAAVAAGLGQDVLLIQVGGTNDPLLPGVRDLRGRTTVRETAALLHASELFIGLVGFLMHLARAVECPAVIVYGGRERPVESGYVANVNVSRAPSCSPCWLWDNCPNAMVCMDEIRPADVLTAITEQLARPRGALPVAHANLALAPGL